MDVDIKHKERITSYLHTALYDKKNSEIEKYAISCLKLHDVGSAKPHILYYFDDRKLVDPSFFSGKQYIL